MEFHFDQLDERNCLTKFPRVHYSPEILCPQQKAWIYSHRHNFMGFSFDRKDSSSSLERRALKNPQKCKLFSGKTTSRSLIWLDSWLTFVFLSTHSSHDKVGLLRFCFFFWGCCSCSAAVVPSSSYFMGAAEGEARKVDSVVAVGDSDG